MLMSHPDLPGVVRDVTDDAFADHWSNGGWVEAYPPPELETDEDEDTEPTEEDQQEES